MLMRRFHKIVATNNHVVGSLNEQEICKIFPDNSILDFYMMSSFWFESMAHFWLREHQVKTITAHEAAYGTILGYDRHKHYYLVYTRAGHDLFRHQINSDHQLYQFLFDICSELLVCHVHGFYHGDIKPNNIVQMSRGECHLIDWGTAMPQEFAKLTAQLVSNCTTTLFVPPEARSANFYSCTSSDCWQLGITLAVLITGRFPFCMEQRQGYNYCNYNYLMKRIQDYDEPWQYFVQLFDDNHVSPNRIKKYAKVLAGLLTFDPNERWTINDVVDFLQLKIIVPHINKSQSSPIITELPTPMASWLTKHCHATQAILDYFLKLLNYNLRYYQVEENQSELISLYTVWLGSMLMDNNFDSRKFKLLDPQFDPTVYERQILKFWPRWP